ncbi:MAG: exodeoxyribonuclease III [Bdellovibrionota bacterium]
MKIISWNVNGIRACAKKGLSEFLESAGPDIFCVQETKANIEQVEEPIKRLGFEYSFWSSAHRKGYSGVATFVNKNPEHVEKGWGLDQYDTEGRIVITDHGPFDLYNIYFPNGGSGDERHNFKQIFLKELNIHLKEKIKKGRELIILGDYNVAHREIDVYDPVRLSKESGFLPEERAWFDSFIELGFVDTFRHFYPNEKNKYSWWSYRELARISNRGWRIDCISVTKGLTKKLQSAQIMDDVEGSDHCPIAIEIDI